MKKLVSIFLVLVLAVAMVVLSACANNQPAASSSAPAASSSAPAVASSAAPAESSAPAASSPAAAGKYNLVTVVKITTIPWFQRMDVGIKKFATDTGNNATMDGPADTADPAQQVSIIESLIAKKINGLGVVPMSVEALEPVLKKARDAGIKVVSHEASSQQNIDYDIEAFANNEFGAQIRKMLIEKTGKTEGEYATFVGGLTSKTHMEWQDGGDSIMKDYPGFKEVEHRLETADDAAKAESITKELIKKYPKLSFIQGCAQTDAMGAAKAIEEAGLQDKIQLGGAGLVSASGSYLETGAVDILGFWDPADAGYAINTMLTWLLDGKTDMFKDGMKIGDLKGYESCKLDGKVFYGKAWNFATKDNYKDFNF
jgi:simple sugar transport system substrate-binding protein